MTERPEALIVGGGLAGSALAIALAGAGRPVLLLEREAGPHDKVCGEFLSREAALYLAALDIDLVSLGAHRIDRVRLAVGRRVATMGLPFPALSLSRRVLDEALLQRAAKAGAGLRRGARVQSLASADGDWRARLQDGTEIDAGAAFLATGKHDLRGWARPPGVQSDLVGFKMHWRLRPAETAALSGHVELTPFPGGYAGLEPVEGGSANLCLVVRQKRFAAVGRQWEPLIAAVRAASPLLDRRLDGAEPCWDRPLAISAIPYGYLRRDGDLLWRLGDQAAVIPSFVGDGMSIALHSARLAADCYLAGDMAALYQRRLARDLAAPMRLATILSQALVRPAWQEVLGAAARALPGLISHIAGTTRIPAAALRRAGLGIA